MARLLVQFVFVTVIVSILGFGFFLAYQPWLQLSKTFGSKLSSPETFIEQQSCRLGDTNIRGYVNVGITEQKLYLSHTPPLSHFIHPLLINLDAITKIESCFDSLLGGVCYKIFIGEPHITTLILAQDLIAKLEEDYSESLFSDKLRQI